MQDFDLKVLAFFAAYAIHDSVWWQVHDGQVTWLVTCNDEFSWGCAACEEITPNNLPVLKQAMVDALAVDENAKPDAIELFVARVRQMRPQNASYDLYNKALWPLFDACGPERKKDFGNPYTREQAEQEHDSRRGREQP